jgi:hypothetical protein
MLLDIDRPEFGPDLLPHACGASGDGPGTAQPAVVTLC